jgi:hypothetical protein
LSASLAFLTTKLSPDLLLFRINGGTQANKINTKPTATKANKKEITPINNGARWHHIAIWLELPEILPFSRNDSNLLS